MRNRSDNFPNRCSVIFCVVLLLMFVCIVTVCACCCCWFFFAVYCCFFYVSATAVDNVMFIEVFNEIWYAQTKKWDKKNNNLWLKQHEFHSHSKYQCVARNGNQKYMHRYLYQTTRAEKSRKKNRIYFLPSIDFFKWKFIEIKRKIHIHFTNTSFWGIYNGLHIVHDSR